MPFAHQPHFTIGLCRTICDLGLATTVQHCHRVFLNFVAIILAIKVWEMSKASEVARLVLSGG
eukprot:3867014-Amphidinium_carterae.1